MPNWIRNVVIPKDYENFSKYVKSKDSDFDFNRICPRPASLSITSPTKYVIRSFYTDNNRLLFQKNRLDAILDNLYSDAITCEDFVKLAKDFCKSIGLDQKIFEVYEIKDEPVKDFNGDTNYYDEIFMAYFNLHRYGSTDWYDWSVKNWGTKWNTSDAMSCNGILTFDTAWSTPTGIWTELAKKFDFVVLYADEDIGSNCGAIVVENGEEDCRLVNDNNVAIAYARMVWDGVDYEEYEDLEDACVPTEEERKQAQTMYEEILEYWK